VAPTAKSVFSISIEITGGERPAQILTRRFTSQTDIRVHLAVLGGEDIDPAGRRGVPIRSDSQVGFAIGIEVARSERRTEIVARGFAGDDDIGGGAVVGMEPSL
jgi:hypothetical protein